MNVGKPSVKKKAKLNAKIKKKRLKKSGIIRKKAHSSSRGKIKQARRDSK